MMNVVIDAFWRFGLVALVVVSVLTAYILIINPELQAFKRNHPEWVVRHPDC